MRRAWPRWTETERRPWGWEAAGGGWAKTINIIGCFRSVNGSQAYQYIASLLATWRLQGKNMFEELEKLVVKEICLR